MGAEGGKVSVVTSPVSKVLKACDLKGGVMDGDGVAFWTADCAGGGDAKVVRFSVGFKDDPKPEVDDVPCDPEALTGRARVAVSLARRCSRPKKAVVSSASREEIQNGILRGKVARGHLEAIKACLDEEEVRTSLLQAFSTHAVSNYRRYRYGGSCTGSRVTGPTPPCTSLRASAAVQWSPSSAPRRGE